MAVHFNEGADLSQVDGLPVAKSHNLVKGKDQAEAVVQDVRLIHVPESLNKNSFKGIAKDLPTILWYDPAEEPECLKIFQNVTRLKSETHISKPCEAGFKHPSWI